uniref:anthrax toxin receptor-like n=1 Tax=Panthera onca TaxID=9690 RepID=UPI002952A9B2|nr:anthrax toxin receptor-like [Panthera onca]
MTKYPGLPPEVATSEVPQSQAHRSGSVNNNWMDIYNLVEDFVKKFENPKLRISFITYSTEGHTLMKLTSDKNEISDGLNKLQNTVPTGATNMHEGFKKANEQIEKANSGENKVPSMIISLTEGTLLPESFDETKYEAAKARKMGSTIYAIGVKDYRKDQLLEIADSPEHMIGVDNGFKELRSIVEPLTSKACIEITKVEPLHLCAGGKS